MINLKYSVLTDQFFFWYLGTEISGTGYHVTVGQFRPGLEF